MAKADLTAETGDHVEPQCQYDIYTHHGSQADFIDAHILSSRKQPLGSDHQNHN